MKEINSSAADRGSPRVVSLLASATEMVCALGMRHCLVGRSHECDFPPDVLDLPGCSCPRIDIEVNGRSIDESVRELLRRGEPIYLVDGERMRRLKPDLILTQSTCEVCAVHPKDYKPLELVAVGWRPEIVALSAETFSGIWLDIEHVAQALGVPEKGRALLRELQARVQAIKSKLPAGVARPGLVCIEWVDPLMAAGNWMPEMVEIAGGTNLLGEAGKHSPGTSWDSLRELNPDLILIAPCGFNLVQTRREMPVLIRMPGWEELRAVKSGRVYLADGNQYFNRPGPRIVESIEILAEILHPKRFHFGHEGSGWMRWA